MASQEPISAAQLQAARSTAWRQTGEPILTLEAAQQWLAPLGLVLFAPRAQQLGAPAPSLVEATLGAANETPSLAGSETARTLAARLVGEGHAVPLNLLGGPGDLPDFLATAQVFSFLYTLRGDKLWKQPPTASGTNSVTPLAVRVYELLAERGVLSAAELATELGRELTESAVARALHELWQHLRVIPLLQQGEGATLWELTTRRFTKAIKAGTNAGQPTALSALVSLYLAQALLASEEEVASFLSPVSPRSRIREVLHALVGARELHELVIDGKTLVHIPGALPEFAEIQPPEAPSPDAEAAEGTDAASEPAAATEGSERGERIKRFAPARERDSSAFRGKSSAGPGFRSKPAGGGFRKSSGDRDSSAPPSPRAPRREGVAPSDRERRPFQRAEGATARPRPERSQYAKPWDEDRKPRPDASEGAESRPARAPRPTGDRPYRAKPAGNRTDRGDRPDRKSFGSSADRKPYVPRKPFGDRPPRSSEGGEDRPRRSFSASSDRPPRAPRASSGDRPEGAKPFRPRTGPPSGGDRPYRPRPAGDGEDRPRRSFSASSSDRTSRGAGFSRGPGSDRGTGAGRPPREGGFRPVRREGSSEGASESRSPRPPFRRDSGDTGRPPRAGGSRPSFGDRPRSGPPSGDRKPYSRPRSAPAGESAGGEERPRRPITGDRKPFDRAAKPGGFGKPGGFTKRTPGASSRPSFGGKPSGEKRSFGKGPAKGSARGFSKGPSKGPGSRPAGSPSARPPRRPKTDE